MLQNTARHDGHRQRRKQIGFFSLTTPPGTDSAATASVSSRTGDIQP